MKARGVLKERYPKRTLSHSVYYIGRGMPGEATRRNPRKVILDSGIATGKPNDNIECKGAPTEFKERG